MTTQLDILRNDLVGAAMAAARAELDYRVFPAQMNGKQNVEDTRRDLRAQAEAYLAEVRLIEHRPHDTSTKVC